MQRKRLDQALVDRGLSPSRSQARDLVRRGCVSVAGVTVSKPSLGVRIEDAIAVVADAQPFVSRGGLKLAAALDAFSLSAAGRVCLDIGASTGGFTHVLLDRGAVRVYAIDVGHGQLSPRLSDDSRVMSRENCDARLLSRADVPDAIGGIVVDASFISLTSILDAPMALAAAGAWLVALIKPQFEVGRDDIGSGGIVRDDDARQRACAKVEAWLSKQPGWTVIGIIPSPIAGGGGNIEFLIGATRDE